METVTKVLTAPDAAPTTFSSTEVPPDTKLDSDYEKTIQDEGSKVSIPPTKENSEAGSIASPTTPSPQAADQEAEYISGAKLIAVIASITLVAFLMLLDTSIVATAVPSITNDFRSLPDVGWYGSAYQLSNAALQPLTGKIYSKFNVKWTFLSFFALFELGSLICGAANSSKMLIVGRAIAGMGGSGLMNGAMTIIASSAPLHRQPALMGILMGFAQLGVVSGPLIGGALTQYSTWRWCFYINLPIGGLVFFYMTFVNIPDRVEKAPPLTILRTLHHDLDLVGFVLLAPAAVQLLLALQWGGNTYAWNSATVIGLFCGAGATSIVWFLWNYRRGDNALIPLSMVRKQAVWSSSLTSMWIFVSLLLSSYFLPIYFQAIKGATPSTSGVDVLPSIISQLVTAVASGAIVSKTGYTIPYALFANTLIAIGCGLLSRLGPDTPTVAWAGYQVIAGFGRGAGMQMPLISIQTVLKPTEISIAMSLLMFTQFIGTAVFLVIANTIFTQSLKSELASEAPNVNAEAIIDAGATAFRQFVSPADLPGVLLAYSNSIDRVFYLVAAAGVLGFATSWWMGWVDIRKKKTPAATGSDQA